MLRTSEPEVDVDDQPGRLTGRLEAIGAMTVLPPNEDLALRPDAALAAARQRAARAAEDAEAGPGTHAEAGPADGKPSMAWLRP